MEIFAPLEFSEEGSNQYPFWIGTLFGLIMVSLVRDPFWWMVTVLGGGANSLVCAANGWKMPVRGMTEEGIRHTPMTRGSRYKLLADIIPVGFGKASIGDFILWAGLLAISMNHPSFTAVGLMILAVILWWGSGWASGFGLMKKWNKEARKDARKNIPIVLILMMLGHFLNIRGCGTGDLKAAVNGAESVMETRKVSVAKPPEKKWRSLGMLQPPPMEVLKRLRQDAQNDKREAAIKAVASLAIGPSNGLIVFAPSKVSEKSERKGPFCRVTCAAHHGTSYDVETVPELCNANWIPPDAYQVPGWYSQDSVYEITNPWPGPAVGGFESYKLYWSHLQSEARVLHKMPEPK